MVVVLLRKYKLDQCLIGSGWVALTLFYFGMTSLNSGFNLLKLTQNYGDNINNLTMITHSSPLSDNK